MGKADVICIESIEGLRMRPEPNVGAVTAGKGAPPGHHSNAFKAVAPKRHLVGPGGKLADWSAGVRHNRAPVASRKTYVPQQFYNDYPTTHFCPQIPSNKLFRVVPRVVV